MSGVELTGVSKHFGGNRALSNVDFTAGAGEVHALLGQNGSGKSTLVKIMTGFHSPDPGARMRLWGMRVNLPVLAAHKHGIAVIHQDLGLAEEMNVLENLGVTSGYGARLLAPIASGKEREICTQLLRELDLDIDPHTLVSKLSPAERAIVAIARAKRLLAAHGEHFAFVLDEPTAYLSTEESDRVLTLMRSVADAGSVVVFISHRLQEVDSVADRITVLRDGQVADTFRGGEGKQGRIIDAMLGRRLEQFYPQRPKTQAAQVVLSVKDLAGRRLDGISFQAAPGEIVGFAGLVGMGHEELPYLLAGTERARRGQAFLGDSNLMSRSVAGVLDLGVSLVPGNRQRDGIWPAGLARENLALPCNRREFPLRPLRIGRERRAAQAAMTQFGVRPPDPECRVGQFSGGNQQKIVLAKWMSEGLRVLLLDEPTQGIDAGAKFDVLNMICEAARAGVVVLVASGDYEQLAHLCHRVIVLRYGRIAAELTGEEITEAAIAHVAQGEGVPAG